MLSVCVCVCVWGAEFKRSKGVALPAQVAAALGTGACVEVRGVLARSPGKGQAVELAASRVVVLGAADKATYPLQKKACARRCPGPGRLCVWGGTYGT